MTHNFDFYRTLEGRFVGRKFSKMVSKSIDEISIIDSEYLKPFDYFKDKLDQDNKILIATIPFIRNLAEYTAGNTSNEFIKLTSLLHIKTDSLNLTINDLEILFKNRSLYIEELDIDIFISITLGISIAQEEPIKTAGIALKKAKKSNLPYFVYNNEIDTKDMIEKSIYWREKMKKAIENNDVVPFYQPIFDKNKNLVKYETLMRIKDINEKGETIYLSPYLFLDISVKTKQYLQLSHQVISKALVDLMKTDKQISINLGFKDILDADFIDSLDINLNKIEEKDKSRIIFEILESDYISDYSVLEVFIIKYRSQGIKIAIDDFGTGYSNFAHILKIRPNYIKIDGSLIKNINSDKNSYEMVKSIIDFSKALNIKTIAEFVHSQEVFDLLIELGVEEFQGFYLAEPLPNIF